MTLIQAESSPRVLLPICAGPSVALLRLSTLLLIGLTSVQVAAQFLVRDQEYRCPPSDSSCRSSKNLSSFEERISPNLHRPYSVNYVEFNDKGELWNSRELTDALDQIESARNGGQEKPLVVVYIHGWQNNASDSSGDVAKFRDILLAHLADTYPSRVLGIYLAWRGLTFTVEPFKHIVSYWPRRSVARHEGQTGMYDAVSKILAVINKDGHRKDYFLVFAGHSFGARVLENAADAVGKNHYGFMAKYRMQESATFSSTRNNLMSEEDRIVTEPPPADLFLYINAASSSAVTRRTLRDIREKCRNNSLGRLCSTNAFYVAVTSHADLATGIILPIANFVFPALTSDGLHLISAANTPSLHTHKDAKKGCDSSASVCFKVTEGSEMVDYSIERIGDRVEIPGKSNDPFWVFNVGKEVMKDHGDVWNPSVTDLVTKIIQENPRFQILAALYLQNR